MPKLQVMPRAARFAASLATVAMLVASPAGSRRAHAIGLDALGVDPNSMISTEVIQALTSFVGFGIQHRPYEPATPLGLAVGLDFSVEATLFKVPDSLFESLSSLGSDMSSPLPALPMAKIHLHKGFGDRIDIGGSAIYIPNNWAFGGDAKLVLVQGEEGPTYAVRFCYTKSKLSTNGFTVEAATYSPQILMSRQMEFADPYLGAALSYVRGAIGATLTVTPDMIAGDLPEGVPVDSLPAVDPYEYDSPVATALTGSIFGGVSIKIPRSGLRLTLEGSYDVRGVHTMGAKFGFTF